MVFSTESLVTFDECERKFAWIDQYEPPRKTLAIALYQSLAEGLKSGIPEKAKHRLLRMAANPGLAISGTGIYDVAIHHATLLELLCTYLLSTEEGRWKRADSINLGPYYYRPQSYLLQGNRIRRVVLATAWTPEREAEERNSWRTLGDMAMTGKPMVINVLIIGSLKFGKRLSPWTKGYLHPKSQELRIMGRPQPDNNNRRMTFNDSWKQIWRETHQGVLAKEWLGVMQKDHAFDEVVKTITIDLPPHITEVRAQVERMLARMAEGGTGETRRASCYRAFYPCQFAPICTRGLGNPLEGGFDLKSSSK